MTASVLGKDDRAWTRTEATEVGNTTWGLELEEPADTLDMGPEGEEGMKDESC